MANPRSIFLLALVFAAALPASAQRAQRQTLSSAQIEQIREAGIDPNQRIRLYTKFLDERAEAIQKLTSRSNSPARARLLDDALLDFTALIDELGSNLDQYGDRKADMRPALKKLNASGPNWMGILRALPGEPTFDEARKEAIEACGDLLGDSGRLEKDQLAYFRAHKDEKGQERAEPK